MTTELHLPDETELPPTIPPQPEPVTAVCVTYRKKVGKDYGGYVARYTKETNWRRDDED